MSQYMVIERFREGHSASVYDRFQSVGRMLPDGLEYIDSWLTDSDEICYQIMETTKPDSFETWIAKWSDLVDFEVIKLKDKPMGRNT